MNAKSSETHVRDDVPLPAWATEGEPWEGPAEGWEHPWRIVRRVGTVAGRVIEVNAAEESTGVLHQVSVDFGHIDGRILDDAPVEHLRAMAAFLTEAAAAIEGAR